MNFDKKPKSHALRGASKPEVSKETLVKELEKQRSERGERRKRESAAEKLQSIWKGRRTRIEVSRDWLDDWGVQYFPIVSNTDVLLPIEELLQEVLPPVLNSVLPVRSFTLRRVLQKGDPLTAENLTNPVVVRGMLALILRSLSSPDSHTNYTSLFTEQSTRFRWLVQCRRLLILCCGIVGSEELMTDELLQAAAVRTITLLMNMSSWKGVENNDASEAMMELLQGLSQTPVLFHSLRRLLEPGLDPTVSKNHVESILRSVLDCLSTEEDQIMLLFPFVRSVLTIKDLQEKLSRWIGTQRLITLKQGFLIRLKSLFLALERIQDFSAVDRWTALRNLTTLSAGDFIDRMYGNGQKMKVLITNEVIGNQIPLEVYLHQTLRILKHCVSSCSSNSNHWKQEVQNALVFSEQVHLMHLLNLFKKQNYKNLNLLATVYLTLIHELSPDDKSVSMPYCNVVAFASEFFPVIWTWISRDLNIPSEASIDDEKGWKLQNLKNGMNSMTPSQTSMVGLFCQSYCHLLLVLDDEDFHQRQLPLSLEQNRAIAVFLANLAFNTFCVSNSALVSPMMIPDEKNWQKVVEEFFPVLLQSLYERDTRNSFCPARLWLSPFLNSDNPVDEKAFIAPGVIQTILNRANGSTESTSSGLCNLLLTAPQCIPFKNRVEVFRNLIQGDKDRSGVQVPFTEGGPRPIVATIHRTSLLKDAVQQLSHFGERLKGRLFVTFIDSFNMEEPGIDQGGLTVELIEEVMKAGFSPDTGLFQRNEEGFLYANETVEKFPQLRSVLYFLGQMLGKALYEGLLMDVPLAPFFLLRVQGQGFAFDDLATLDQELHRSLIQVKRYDGDVSDLGLDFSVEADIFGKRVLEELIPGGTNIPVTNNNKLLYVHLMADWHIQKRVGQAVQSFSAGLGKLIPIPWLKLFNPKELNALLSGGGSQDFDVEDLRRHTVYKNGYSDNGLVVRAFWRVVHSFKAEEKTALLKFVTSCSRPPLGGFKHLQPPFTICKVDCTASPWALLGGQDVEMLPTASTCANMLKLPNYRRSSSMKKKLLLAITSNSGFGYS